MSINNLIKGIERTQFQIKTHLGFENKTKDDELLRLKQMFFQKEKGYRRFRDKVQKFSNLYFEANKATYKAFMALRKITVEGKVDINPQSASLSSIQYSMLLTEREIVKMEKRVKNELLLPLKEYLKQFKVMNKRIEECHKRRIDMDRYKESHESPKSENKVENKLRYESAKNKYEKLRDEIVFDLTEVLNFVDVSVEQLGGIFINIMGEFYGSTNLNFNTVSHLFQHQLFDCSLLITNEKESMMDEKNVSNAVRANYSPKNRNPRKRSSSQEPRICGTNYFNELTKEEPLRPQENTHQTKIRVNSFAFGVNENKNSMPTRLSGSYDEGSTQYCDGLKRNEVLLNDAATVGLYQPWQCAQELNIFPLEYQPISTRRVICECDYNQRNSEELSFRKGEIITVLNTDGIWWFGEIGNRKGYFVCDLVREIN